MVIICSQTVPLPIENFSGEVNSWTIYDFYESQELLREKADNVDNADASIKLRKKKIGLETTDESEKEKDVSKRMLRSAKVLERMLNLTIHDEIAQDFRFWEDLSDEFKEGEGSLLPLWKFKFDVAKELEITSTCWNHKYSDLFAASYGSYDFYKQVKLTSRRRESSKPWSQAPEGYVCLFSLKNPAFPEFLRKTTSGVSKYVGWPGWQFGNDVFMQRLDIYRDFIFQTKFEAINLDAWSITKTCYVCCQRGDMLGSIP